MAHKIEVPGTVRATDFLHALGYNTSITKGGAGRILAELNRLGIEPAATRVVGKGISFFVSDADARKFEEKRLQQAAASSTNVSRQQRRDLRSVARAVRELYKRLGEVPNNAEEINRIAEREEAAR